MPTWLLALCLDVVIGLTLGIFVARRSEAEKPIKGGTLAKVFHFLGATAFMFTAPTVLICAVILRYPLLRNVLIGVGSLACAAIFLLIYAYFEARAAKFTSL
ncbi:MAG: hypothetical protein ABI947_29775 [Chloroflexota bacterium]